MKTIIYNKFIIIIITTTTTTTTTTTIIVGTRFWNPNPKCRRVSVQ